MNSAHLESELGMANRASVRYLVDDVDAALKFLHEFAWF